MDQEVEERKEKCEQKHFYFNAGRQASETSNCHCYECGWYGQEKEREKEMNEKIEALISVIEVQEKEYAVLENEKIELVHKIDKEKNNLNSISEKMQVKQESLQTKYEELKKLLKGGKK